MLRSALGHAKRSLKKNPPPAIKTWRIVRGDQVEVTEGKFKGRQGTVIKSLRKTNQLVIDGVNEYTRLTKVSPDAKPVEMTFSAPLHYSNVQLVDPSTGKPTKVGIAIDAEGNKVRVARKTGAIIPRPDILTKRHTPKPVGEYDTPREVANEVTYDEATYTPQTVFDAVGAAERSR
eukprot:TRINITY_DN8876_c0_g1_i2.p1 TRINITY_DN8876_c0_g1~~TRINITY_DN8876_c0_g1_i2.p1  ORF type:complete len:176 (-),score=24.72 TRINITY_DN8876_c0_g1_i2:135-662(-)